MMLLRPVSRLAPARTRAHVHAFGSPEYWTGFYADPRHERFEWFVDAERALALMRPRLRALRAARVLHVGAGTSTLGPSLATDGVDEVVNLDVDEDACRLAEAAWREEVSRHAHGASPHACSWHTGDLRALPAHWSERFDAAVPIFERLATNARKDNLRKFNSFDYLLRASLCLLADGEKEALSTIYHSLEHEILKCYPDAAKWPRLYFVDACRGNRSAKLDFVRTEETSVAATIRAAARAFGLVIICCTPPRAEEVVMMAGTAMVCVPPFSAGHA